MVNMENAEEVLQILERYTRLKQKEIPKELDEYLQYVAKTGDTVFKWPNLKYLFREKLLNVLKHFHDSTPRAEEIPQYPNVDPFNFESMKSSLLERLELFNAAPFTIQRLCELLTDPKKQYGRIDKYMRALEKNILVVSTIEPGRLRSESENGDSLDSVVNGDLSLDVNVDIDMDNEAIFNIEAQNGNGNRADVAELVTAEDDDDEEHLDEPDEPEEPDEEEPEKRLTETPHVLLTHKSDDDVLPKSKKLKLDLSEDELRKELKEDNDKKAAGDKLDVKQAESENEKKSESAKAITSPTKRKSEERETEKDLSTSSSRKVVVLSSADVDITKKKQQQQQLAVVKEKKPSTGSGDECKEKHADKQKQTQKEKLEDIDKQELQKLEQKSVEKEDEAIESADAKLKTEHKTQLDAASGNSETKHPKEKLTSTPTETTDKTVPKQVLEKDVQDAIIVAKKKHTDIAADIEEEKVKAPETKTSPINKTLPADVCDEKKSQEQAEILTVGKIDETSIKVKAATELVDKTEKQPIALVAAVVPTVAAAVTETKNKIEKKITEIAKIENSAVKSPLGVPIEEDAPIAAAAAVVSKTLGDIVKSDAPPILALNDQPMDAELPVHVAISVEEVVMAESSGGATAMATDEQTKDEPAGMEIDDTSQEAMDQ